MSTTDVPGAKAIHNDVLGVGNWAEHEDGSLILVEGVEAGKVVYSIFDVAVDPPVEYRDAMSEYGFKQQFSWDPKAKSIKNIKWTWHDKTEFPWERVMADFPAGEKTSAVATLSAAARVGQSLELRAQAVQERHKDNPTPQREARTIMQRLAEAKNAFLRA